MRKSVLFFLLSLALVASFSAQAAKPDDYKLLEEIPPPPIDTLEGQTFEKPTITIKKEGENTVEEYSINGDVYMVKVTPPNGTPYYLHREDRDGAWLNDGPTPLPSIPKWVIFRF